MEPSSLASSPASVAAVPADDAPARGAASEAEGSELRPWIARVAWTLVALGVLARLVRYLANRSLWRDECALALNVVERSFAGLLEPLQHDQVAPIGFLWLERAAVALFGEGEYALRLVPLLAGLAAVLLFHLTARELLARREAAVATALFAVSEPLIFYASELKQYSSDVFACLALLLPAVRIHVRGTSVGRVLAFAAAGVVGVWLSIPAVFVCAGAGVSLVLRALVRRRLGEAAVLVLVGAACAGSFAAHYLPYLAPAQANAYLAESWETFLAPVPGLASFDWYRHAAFAVFNDPLGFPSTGLAAAACLVGVVVLARRSALAALALLAPVALALLASILGKMPFPVSDEHHLLERVYPFPGRLLLFLAPLLLLPAGAGLALLLRASDARRGFAGPIVAVLLLAIPVFTLVRNTLAPPLVQEMRPLAAEVASRFQEGDQIYAQTFSLCPVAYYARRAGLPPPAGELQLRRTREQQEEVRRTLARLPPGTRLWFVTLHHPNWDSEDELRDLRMILKGFGERVEHFEGVNGEVALYVPGAPESGRARPSGPVRRGRERR